MKDKSVRVTLQAWAAALVIKEELGLKNMSKVIIHLVNFYNKHKGNDDAFPQSKTNEGNS